MWLFAIAVLANSYRGEGVSQVKGGSQEGRRGKDERSRKRAGMFQSPEVGKELIHMGGRGESRRKMNKLETRLWHLSYILWPPFWGET